MTTPVPRVEVSVRRTAWLLFLLLLAVYNANGREMPTYDSQPTKLAARELALYGRLTLDRVVARTPELGNRAGFQKDLHGHYRSAYSVVPALAAAIPGSLLHLAHLVDLRAPLAPSLVAKLTASTMVAGAMALVFLGLARGYGRAVAFWVAGGLGVGTNLWPLASGTLWQMESVTFGLALALWCWYRDPEHRSAGLVALLGFGLAMAAGARVQVAPASAILALGLVVRGGWRRALPGLAAAAAVGSALMAAQWLWYGSVLGGAPALQAASFSTHAVEGVLAPRPWEALLGLLVSPSRGLLLFSPIVMIPVIAVRRVVRGRSPFGEGWWLLAALVELIAYSSYSMWWGGHTYGPRYLVDLLVPLAPSAAVGVLWVMERRWRQGVALAALAVSVVVAGTGAFVYPADGWNLGDDVDTHHERLWDWRDMQVVRCWRSGLSPQNYSLLDWGAIRQLDSKAP